MSSRVLLHVGTPKTGTSYLQDVLYRNRRTLVGHGVLYPADRFDAHFLAALDLMRLPWGGLEAEAVGAWDRLAGRVRRHEGTAIISHEILATATRAQAERALESLRHGEGTRIDVVVSARDLVRQIPAEWQENIKHRATLSYADFLAELRDPAREGRIASWFWGVQELPDILDRWARHLPPEQVHVVTVPPPDGPRELLWQRFSRVFGLDGLDLDLQAERVNPSMGVPETALVRWINHTANRDLRPADYRPLVRELLAHQTLSRRSGSPRLALPPDLHAWVEELTGSWIEEIERRGYDVVGDLAELQGPAPTGEWADPDEPDELLVGRAARDAVIALLLEGARLRSEQDRLREELTETQIRLERSYLRPTYRWRERTYRRLTTSTTGRQALKSYRRLRGRPVEE